MQKILILGMWAFGFAIAKYLWENHPEKTFYATEKNPEIFKTLESSRLHPYFFPGAILRENIKLLKNINTILPEIDIIISVIPCQFTGTAFEEIKTFLKEWVTILNLSKGINNQSLKVVSETLAETLKNQKYSYAYLAGGMISEELVLGMPLGADIACQEEWAGEILRNLFQSEKLDIHLIVWNTKNTELSAALKNIVALVLWYYEGLWYGASSLGRVLVALLKEMELLSGMLAGETELRFTDYAWGGDIIATCFGASRNRQLGNMLGKNISLQDALQELKSQKKIAEGYETLKGIYKLIKGKEEFELIGGFVQKYL
jgi:glycerol-3-phosphate dehydrogenase (NAD(P)+)